MFFQKFPGFVGSQSLTAEHFKIVAAANEEVYLTYELAFWMITAFPTNTLCMCWESAFGWYTVNRKILLNFCSKLSGSPLKHVHQNPPISYLIYRPCLSTTLLHFLNFSRRPHREPALQADSGKVEEMVGPRFSSMTFPLSASFTRAAQWLNLQNGKKWKKWRK